MLIIAHIVRKFKIYDLFFISFVYIFSLISSTQWYKIQIESMLYVYMERLCAGLKIIL